MTTTLTPILLDGANGLFASAAAQAIAQRDDILTRSRRGTTITTPDGAVRCADLLRELGDFDRYIEAGRTEAKAPILEVGRNIDALAKTLTSDVQAEKKRLSGILGVWQAEQDRIARQKREEAEAEERRIRMEAAEAQRKVEDEARRVQAEADDKAAQVRAALEAKAAKARSAKAQEAAAVALREAEERKAREDAERATLAVKQAEAASDVATAAIISTRVAAVNAVPAKPAGIATRQEVCFEVEDITKLFEAAPYLCTITANATALKAALKALPEGQHLPGVRHWREARSSVR